MNTQSAIQGVIAALKNQAASIALANNVYTPADWGNDPETHAKAEHDGLLLWADSLQAVANRITQLETENAAHLAHIAQLESQLAAETGRLDFVIKEFAFVEHSDAGSRLKAVCEFDEQVSISGDGLHPTPRAAIDAAIGLAKGGA